MRRIEYTKVLPEAVDAVYGLHSVVKHSTLEKPLLELIKVRASQLNGCAFCLDMHTKDARALGETEQRLYMVAAWHEAEHLYSDRERAALRWCEALTLLPQTGAPDDAYAEVARAFSPEEQVALSVAICEINSWNRLAVGFRSPAGDYVSPYSAEYRERRAAEKAREAVRAGE